MGNGGYHNTGFLFVSFGLNGRCFITQFPVVTGERLSGLFSRSVRITPQNGGSARVAFRAAHVARLQRGLIFDIAPPHEP
jgi:hypothetical protein